MKKLLTLATMATLLMAGSAFAQWGRHAVAQPNASFGYGVTANAATGPTTTNNDDSCDISVTPAATLLLPYFEVETGPTRGTDTFFTITNTSPFPQIAHVVVWTDYSVPVLDFNVFLTGYDVQPLSMLDIIVNGVIAPVGNGTDGGTSSTPSTTKLSVDLSPIGQLSKGWVSVDQTKNTNAGMNPNIPSLSSCGTLPGIIPPSLVNIIQNALIKGTHPCGPIVGSPASAHPTLTTAIGYVTVDVAAVCSVNLGDAAQYYASEILFDNVLIGDYQILNKNAGSNYAGGNPMVHIRAIPEGGLAGVALTGTQTNLPYTFYSRYITGQTVAGTTYDGVRANYDRRQPLPSTFAARYIQGGATSFNTSYRIWREGITIGVPGCGTKLGVNNAIDNAEIPITEITRFDEHENPSVAPSSPISGGPGATGVSLPETSTTSTTNGNVYPQFSASGVSPAGDYGGWMYLNLDSGLAPTLASLLTHPTWPGGEGVRASQNWVVVSMTGSGSTAGLYGVDFDAAYLANGCTPPVGTSPAGNPIGSVVIGPNSGKLVCPTPQESCTYSGTNVTP